MCYGAFLDKVIFPGFGHFIYLFCFFLLESDVSLADTDSHSRIEAQFLMLLHFLHFGAVLLSLGGMARGMPWALYTGSTRQVNSIDGAYAHCSGCVDLCRNVNSIDRIFDE